MVIALVAALGTLICPGPDTHERAQDCPWGAIARRAEEAGRRGEPVAPVLAEAAPAVWAQIGSDAKRPVLHEAWGQSRNFDENARAAVIDPPLLTALSEKLGVAGGAIAHAGLQHTYGYLFSTLWTPFGYKRARWVEGELERGLGLPTGLLGPTPSAGSLYANVTCLLTRLSLTDEEAARYTAACRDGAAPAVVAFRRHASHERLEETVAGVGTLRSDWFPLQPGRWLFVYSVALPGATPRLLTTFPVDDAMIDGLRAAAESTAPLKVRYNAHVAGLSERPDLPAPRRRLVRVR